MTIEDALKDCLDIFENIEEYALVGTPNLNFNYRIFRASSMSWVLIEEHSDAVIAKMIELGVRIVNNEEEVRPPGFKRLYPVWDKEKNEFTEVSQEEFYELLEKHKLAKKNRREIGGVDDYFISK